MMVLCVGVGEQVIADAQALEHLQETLMEVFEDLAGGHTLPVSDHSDGRTVRIRARDHQHVVAVLAVVAGADVSGEMGTGDVADVNLGVGVRPGDSDENVF